MPDPSEMLRAAQKPTRAYLWTPADAITFTPAVLGETFGDGRALFGLTTINNRPARWLFRGCSTWSLCGDYDAPEDAPEMAEHVDEIIQALEDEFGSVDTYERNARGDWIDIETKKFVPHSWTDFPVVDAGTGCSWWREHWPDLPGVALVPHPFARGVRILAEGFAHG